MKELLEGSVYFGVLISLGSYAIGMYLRRRTGCSFVNPLLVSIIKPFNTFTMALGKWIGGFLGFISGDGEEIPGHQRSQGTHLQGPRHGVRAILAANIKE